MKVKEPLAAIALTMPWQGEFQIVIGVDWIDVFQDNKRIHSQVRRFPDCLSKEMHYCWLVLLGKFKLDENDMRSNPVGRDFTIVDFNETLQSLREYADKTLTKKPN